ncbi:MAG: molybdopterin molybdotransferase MoeA [Chloroflexota bacterium]|nr:molybdopterin molybdotransferase MoeA [Chloroflexota bacterium]
MSDLLSVDEALTRILQDFQCLPAEASALESAHGRTLADDVIASHDLPPFANSSMDGYAVRSDDVRTASQDAPVRLRVAYDIPAGSTPTQPIQPGEVARIMTGAPMPPGADAVVPVEQTDTPWRAGDDVALADTVAIYKAVHSGANVRYPGEDVRAGERVLTAGTRIRAAEMGVLAGLGEARVSVVRKPRVALLSSGDELLAVDEPLAPGKIRDMNSYTLAALVTEGGGEAIRIPIARDRLEDVRSRFRQALDMQPDIVLSSAGVSAGTADLIRMVLDELGEVGFWKINLRPGKPLAYGKLDGVPFFGLPGNPVSAMVTFDVFVRPALLRLLGAPDLAQVTRALLAEDIASDGRRSYIRVRLRDEGGRLIATTTGTQSSGALSSMVLADGLLIIPEDIMLARAGETYPVRVLR